MHKKFKYDAEDGFCGILGRIEVQRFEQTQPKKKKKKKKKQGKNEHRMTFAFDPTVSLEHLQTLIR